MIQEEKKVSSMEKLNKDLDNKVGAVYYMDESRIRGERIDPKRVVVKEIYPHMIIVEDENGFRSGITLASAAVDLRKTKYKTLDKALEGGR